MNETCPICEDKYREEDKKVEYHVSYKPEVTTYACSGCNYAEFLIRNPGIKSDYFMEHRKNLVKEWTLKNRPLISKKKKILIVGIPGMGKTEIGNYLENTFLFEHLDLEGSSCLSFNQNKEEFITFHSNSTKDTVVTWGFLPDEPSIQYVLMFKKYGFKLVWLDGNREAARKAFIERGTVPEYLLDIQLTRIENSHVVEKISPISYNTFNQDGQFKSFETIARELINI